MLLPESARRHADGRLEIGGCDAAELARRFGTPLYVYDEQTLRGRLRGYAAAVRDWPAGGDVHYSAKAYLGAAMVRLLVEEDCGLDVVSGGELLAALRWGMAAERIGFCGNNKRADELALAAESGIGHLVIDSESELDMLEESPPASRLRALVRVGPGVKPDTHDFISTGQLDSKFGFGVESGAASRALRRAMRLPGVDVQGVHMHIGSQILDLRAHAAAVDIVAAFLADELHTTGFAARHLSVGGGLGIAHTDEDDPPTIGEFMQTVTESVRRSFDSRGLPLPALHVEPGRSVAGPAGVALYTVGTRKEIAGVRTYVSVDGGMGDNIRPKLYGARYQPMLVGPDAGRPLETVDVAGWYCESTDILVHDCTLPRLERGDVIAVPAAGAYALSMSSNYNMALRPAVVFVAGGRARLVRRRETLDDLIGCEVIAGEPVTAD